MANLTRKNIKVNLTHIHSFMHNHTLYDALHQSYVSYLKKEYKVKKGLAPDKNFRKASGRKEGNSNISEFSKNHES